MRHQIPAHLSVVRKGQKGQPSALNGAERNNDFCIGSDGQWAALGDNLRHTLPPGSLTLCSVGAHGSEPKP